MEPVQSATNEAEQHCANGLPFARNYQLEALETAIKQNTIVFLETGSGKTLIAVMLLRNYAHLLRKPSLHIAVFLVPTVVLVTQQSGVVMTHTDLKVGKYWGDMGVDYWDAATWKQQQDEYEVLVMTPKILLNALNHGFIKFDTIKVLIFDECHNARGSHDYACIMKEFYRPNLGSVNSKLPRIFGMTASLVKTKGSQSAQAYWKEISDLENLMNSKVYTCASESVLAQYIPFSTPKVHIYQHVNIPKSLEQCLRGALFSLKEKHENALVESTLSASASASAKKSLDKTLTNFLFCLTELGLWLALEAAESMSSEATEIFSWITLDVFGRRIIKDFSMDASKLFSTYLPSGPRRYVGCNTKAKVDAGYLTSKVMCLLNCLLEYRHLKDLRCIIFVERIITAIVLRSFLNDYLLDLNGWKTKYIAGNSSRLQSQSRQEQNKIVEEFRMGEVNIIVATSILEEGLDVQSCNLVIRFDPSATVCSFIQSRGRARMPNSDFILMVESGDAKTQSRVKDYLASSDIMREESLQHASLPCQPIELREDICYKVDTTGAVVSLSSSVSLLYFYCSRLPSDGYFKPNPRCTIDQETGTCTLQLPNSCPIRVIHEQSHASIKVLKQLACLKACIQLHKIGALTDNLVPDVVEEERDLQDSGCGSFTEEQAQYVPPELVNSHDAALETTYYCYMIELQEDFHCDIKPHNIVLALRTKLEHDVEQWTFSLNVDRGNLKVQVKYFESIRLSNEQVLLCQRFHSVLLTVLLGHDVNKLKEASEVSDLRLNCMSYDYLLIPAVAGWKPTNSISFLSHTQCINQTSHSGTCGRLVHTKDRLVCRCMLENSLVYTPHNGHAYCITGTIDGMDGNSLLNLRGSGDITYKKYFEKRHGVSLSFDGESLLKGKRVFTVRNCLQHCRRLKAKESSHASVELPPELCVVLISPISISTVYSFSFIPSIMHRIESFLLAANLKRLYLDDCAQSVAIPTRKVLEAITTKKCQEELHLESLETLGDSFLKYAASQQLFKTYQNHHEGLLSIKREKLISNASLFKLGRERKISGFIRNEVFDPKLWIIPGWVSEDFPLHEESLTSTRKLYSKGIRTVKLKTVADVTEALIGAFLSTGGEMAALSFIDWLGLKMDLNCIPYTRTFCIQAEKLVNVGSIESKLNYSFNDPSLIVEALTHGSYMVPDIPRCYQRLEFLGDSVLDFVITLHLYNEYPDMSPGLLTDMRSASVNNDCYAASAFKAGLHKNILHASQELYRHTDKIRSIGDSVSTFGWESEVTLPKVFGDIIESLAGAILVDSGYNTGIVFQSIRPLLEPMVTPSTLRLHPARELRELCQKENYEMKKFVVSRENGLANITVEVVGDGVNFKGSSSAADRNTAERLACKRVLNLLKHNKLVTQES